MTETEKEMFAVDAYLKVTGAGYRYKIVCKGHPRKGDGEIKGGQRRAAVKGLAEMLDRITKPSMITLLCNDYDIVRYINRGFPGKWKQNKWKNSKGETVRNAELWQQVKLESHAIRAQYVKDLEIPGEEGEECF